MNQREQTQLVVDSNYLQNESLRSFLKANRRNQAVLTDYVTYEMYKGGNLRSIYGRMGILSEFPKQVIVLKGAHQAYYLHGRSSGLRKRLICRRSTKHFSENCDDLKQARAGHRGIQHLLRLRGMKASQIMDDMLNNAPEMVGFFKDLQSEFNQEEIRIIRTGKDFTPQLTRKIMVIIDSIYFEIFEGHAHRIRKPSQSELPNTFLYRNAIGFFLFYLRWEEVGGPLETRPEKIRNDIVDVKIATFASYFDGILSNDKNLRGLLERMNFLIDLFHHNLRMRAIQET